MLMTLDGPRLYSHPHICTNLMSKLVWLINRYYDKCNYNIAAQQKYPHTICSTFDFSFINTSNFPPKVIDNVVANLPVMSGPWPGG